MFNKELNAGSNKIIWQIVAVDLHNWWHNQQITTCLENILKLICCIDDGGHAISVIRCNTILLLKIKIPIFFYRKLNEATTHHWVGLNTSALFASSWSDYFQIKLFNVYVCKLKEGITSLRITLSPACNAILPFNTLRNNCISSGWAKLPI